MTDEARRQTENVIRYYAEIDRRVTSAGMDGIAGLLTLSQHVEAALRMVAPQELEWMVRELRALLERLVRMDSKLQQLRALKVLLGADGDEASPSRPRVLD